jgi:hypothetical protein
MRKVSVLCQVGNPLTQLTRNKATTAGNTVGTGTSATGTLPAGAANTAANTPKSGTSTSKAQFSTIAGGFIFLGLSALVLSL